MVYFVKDYFSTARKIAADYAFRNMIGVVEGVRVVRSEPGTDAGSTVKRVYFGPARIHIVGGPQNRFDGDELNVFSGSTISTPSRYAGQDVLTQTGDLLKVTKHIDDEIVGRVFQVIDIDSGGQWNVYRPHQVTVSQKSEVWTYVDEPNVNPWP